MQIKLLKEIVSSFVGQSASKIVDLLYDKKNVNEFLIAKNLNLTINQTRNVLYKLADEGLVSFIRKKDKKKGGWYTYFWTLNSGKSLLKFKEKVMKDMASLQSQMNTRKLKRFFYCPNCHIEYTEESALLHDYACPECGEVLILKNNSEDISNIEKEIKKLVEVLTFLDNELSSIQVVEDKVRGRKMKAEERKKKKLRQERKIERDKLAKKEGKKKPVKGKANKKKGKKSGGKKLKR